MSTQHKPRPPARLRVLYEDNHVLGVYKEGGELIQGDRTGDATLLDRCKNYLKKKYKKPGNVFVGLVHRLDRPVSGVALFARTSKGASRLSAEFRSRRVTKIYFAVVMGVVRQTAGEIESLIERHHLKSRIARSPSEKAKDARLSYRVLERKGDLTLLEITPTTGRHHQIRLQLADIGHPVVGDIKYGARDTLDDKTIALHAGILTAKHPTKDENVELVAKPPKSYPWSLFMSTIETRFE